MASAIVGLGKAEVEADTFSMPQVEKSIGLRREARNNTLVFARPEIVFYNLLEEIDGRGGVRAVGGIAGRPRLPGGLLVLPVHIGWRAVVLFCTRGRAAAVAAQGRGLATLSGKRTNTSHPHGQPRARFIAQEREERSACARASR